MFAVPKSKMAGMLDQLQVLSQASQVAQGKELNALLVIAKTADQIVPQDIIDQLKQTAADPRLRRLLGQVRDPRALMLQLGMAIYAKIGTLYVSVMMRVLDDFLLIPSLLKGLDNGLTDVPFRIKLIAAEYDTLPAEWKLEVGIENSIREMIKNIV